MKYETSTYWLVKILYFKVPGISKLLPNFPLVVWGLNYKPRRWEASVLPTTRLSPNIFFQIGQLPYASLNTTDLLIPVCTHSMFLYTLVKIELGDDIVPIDY